MQLMSTTIIEGDRNNIYSSVIHIFSSMTTCQTVIFSRHHLIERVHRFFGGVYAGYNQAVR